MADAAELPRPSLQRLHIIEMEIVVPIGRSCLLAALAATALPVEAMSQEAACGVPIAETRGLVESDIATGNLNAKVGKRFRVDLDHAAAVCAAGRAGEALRLLASAKARYGYR